MTRISETGSRQPTWRPKPGEKEAIVAALSNEAYPPRARWGVGSVRKEDGQ